MWDVEYLPGCGMLIYQMPSLKSAEERVYVFDMNIPV